MKDSVFHHLDIRTDGKNIYYIVKEDLVYHSKRYDKYIVCAKGMYSDGATGALDIDSYGWLFHDKLCYTGTWEDGTPCNNWQASQVLSDILKSEGKWFRARSWLWTTWMFGGGEARNNGMW